MEALPEAAFGRDRFGIADRSRTDVARNCGFEHRWPRKICFLVGDTEI